MIGPFGSKNIRMKKRKKNRLGNNDRTWKKTEWKKKEKHWLGNDCRGGSGHMIVSEPSCAGEGTGRVLNNI
jgi:hypothetical protein